jgi:DNA (cytosine-5)-methyltransferase 1
MKSDNPHSGIYEADTSKTLDLNGGNPSCNQGGIAVVESVPYTLKIRSGCEGGGKGALVQEDLSATLSTNNDQYLFQPLVVENHPADSRVNIDDSGKVQTLTSRMGTGGGNVPMVMEAVEIDCYNQAVTGDKAMTLRNKAADSDHIPCVAIDRAYFNQGQNALYEPQLLADGPFATKVETVPSAVCYAVDQGGGKSSANVTENLPPNPPHYIVRRLTPLECERLQGYPDYYTNIGDFLDSKGKKKTSSDAVRYKALGNSICLPPWKWVLKRICGCYERDATMASLFDGIGGFPFLWEQINGKGTAVWCSEIEDFPDAVTKVRIG